MSNQIKNLATAAAGDQGGPPATDPPAGAQHAAIAARVIAAVMAARGEITPFQPPEPLVLPFVRANSSVDLDFMLGVVAIVENNPQLPLSVTIDIPAAKESIAYIQAYVPVINQLEVFLRDLKFSVASRKADVGAQSLRTYDLIKGLARDKKFELTSHAAVLKRALGRTRSAKQTGTPTPQAPVETESGKEGPKSQPEPK